MPWTYVISDLNAETFCKFKTFYKNELQKINQKEFRVEKVIKRKGKKLDIKWRGYDNSLNSWIDKKDIIKMTDFFPKSNYLGVNVKVELDLSNFATKADLKK